MSDTQSTKDENWHFMQLALNEALSEHCIPVQTAFCVGCVLVVRLSGRSPVILSTGYSRELPGNTHAEANALTKARSLSQSHISDRFHSLTRPGTSTPSIPIEELLRHTDVYTTLEPCSIRTSGLSACADALIEAGVRRCVIGVGEPDDFVKCEGAQKLRDAGIEVVWMKGMERQCLEAARRGHRREDQPESNAIDSRTMDPSAQSK